MAKGIGVKVIFFKEERYVKVYCGNNNVWSQKLQSKIFLESAVPSPLKYMSKCYLIG